MTSTASAAARAEHGSAPESIAARPMTPEGLFPALEGLTPAFGEDALLHAACGLGVEIFHAEALAIVVDERPPREYVSPEETRPSRQPDAEYVVPVEVGPPVELRLWRRRPLELAERRLVLLLSAHLGLLLRHARSPEPLARASQPLEDLARIEALTRTLAESEPAEAALAAVETGTELLGAKGGVVAALAPDGSSLELIASTGYGTEIVDAWRRFPLSADEPLARAVRLREPVVADRTSTPRGGDVGDHPRTDDPMIVALPLLAHGAPIGAIGFSFERLEQAEEQWAFLGALSSTCAHALERARQELLYDRLQRLQGLSADLVRAVTTEDVAAVLAASAIDALAADSAVVARVADDSHTIEPIASDGDGAEILEHLRRLPVDAAIPLADAVRLGEPVVCETAEEIIERYPALADEVYRVGTASLVSLPLVADGQCLGAIRVGFGSPRIVDDEQLEFMRSLAQLGGQSVARALQAREQDRTERLQQLTALLSVSGTPDEIGAAIIEAGVDLLGAAGGEVVEMDEGGTVRTLAESGLAEGFFDDWRRRALDETTVVGQLLSHQPLLVGSRREATSVDPWVAERLEELGWGALACVVLRQGDAIRGGLLLVFARERRFAPEDERFLAAVGDLSAQALERAQLHVVVDRSRRRLEALLERLDEGVLTVGRDLRVEYANPGAQAMLGSAAMPGRRLPVRHGSFSLRGFARDVARSANGPVEQRFSQGESTFEIVGIPGDDSTVLVLRDVSHRARRERAEREFVQNAAHELRSPLAAIGSAVEALRLGAKDEAWTRDYFITGMASEADRLGRLVTALLTLAHAQADPDWLTLSPVEIAPTLHEVAAGIPVKPGVRVVVHCPDDAVVLAEPGLLGAALANLAENAARHTDSGTITLSCGEARDGLCTISVRDTGSGIDPATHARVFERFSRDDHEGTGHGLGLAIVRAMAKALRGTLSLSSEPGIGTEATLTLETP